MSDDIREIVRAATTAEAYEFADRLLSDIASRGYVIVRIDDVPEFNNKLAARMRLHYEAHAEAWHERIMRIFGWRPDELMLSLAQIVIKAYRVGEVK